ncbi:retrovirus-related Pol polyprotein from transposon TNT 1-94 [Trichonephila clavipes]|nr:retrovirus-related Pol polyprotein from transposon TNT 1-94 [Trichonephila clavipes]
MDVDICVNDENTSPLNKCMKEKINCKRKREKEKRDSHPWKTPGIKDNRTVDNVAKPLSNDFHLDSIKRIEVFKEFNHQKTLFCINLSSKWIQLDTTSDGDDGKVSLELFMNSVASTLNRVTGMEFNNQISVLTPNNWNTWKHDMQVLLMHYGGWQFILQTKPEQPDEEATYKEKLDTTSNSSLPCNKSTDGKKEDFRVVKIEAELILEANRLQLMKQDLEKAENAYLSSFTSKKSNTLPGATAAAHGDPNGKNDYQKKGVENIYETFGNGRGNDCKSFFKSSLLPPRNYILVVKGEIKRYPLQASTDCSTIFIRKKSPTVLNQGIRKATEKKVGHSQEYAESRDSDVHCVSSHEQGCDNDGVLRLVGRQNP